jgi:hypothetical protein
MRADRKILAADINAARSLVVKLRGRLPRSGNADGSWPHEKRVQDHSAAFHLEAAARHLKLAIESWDDA